MAIASIAQAYAGSVNNSSVTTSAVDTTGANLIVLVVAYGAAPTISDSKGNTYTALTAQTGTATGRIYYCASPTVGSGHTFTASGIGTTYPTILAIAVSGAAASPYDQESGTSSGTQPGSITPSQNDCLVVSGGNFVSATPSSASGMTLIGAVANAGTNWAAGAAYVIQTTATAINPTWDQTGSLVMASFKASAGGAGVVKTVDGVAFASAKTWNGLAIASVKTINGVANA